MCVPRRIPMTMRTTWNGSVSFGLVNIPVGLAPATKPAARQSDVSFRMLHRECGTPIKQKRWCPVHERDVESDELVRGWEVAKGQFVTVEDADLEAIEQHDTSRVDRDQPLRDARGGRPGLFRSHVLPRACGRRGGAPAVRAAARGDEGSRRRRARPVRARRQGEALPDPADGRCARARDAVRPRGRARTTPRSTRRSARPRCKAPELDLAKQIIASLAGPFEPEELQSEYRESLRELLEAKLAGQPFELPESPEIAPVVDLMEALKASVAAASTKKADDEKKKAAPRKRAAASK